MFCREVIQELEDGIGGLPVEIDGALYVDGGLLQNLPVAAALLAMQPPPVTATSATPAGQNPAAGGFGFGGNPNDGPPGGTGERKNRLVALHMLKLKDEDKEEDKEEDKDASEEEKKDEQVQRKRT